MTHINNILTILAEQQAECKTWLNGNGNMVLDFYSDQDFRYRLYSVEMVNAKPYKLTIVKQNDGNGYHYRRTYNIKDC